MTRSPDPAVLTDGTVTLRALRPDDAGDIVLGCRDEQAVRFTTVPAPYAPEDAAAFIAAHGPDGWLDRPAWAITMPAVTGDRWGGTIDLRPDGAGGADLGYMVAPWLRGRGAATRAVRLACRWGFSSLGLQVVTWVAYAGNDASRAVAERAGFRVSPEPLRRLAAQRGERRDAWIGTLLPEDLDAPRPASSRPALTGREREVLDAIARGRSNRAIAAELGISENTVKNHVRRILEKLQASSRMEAVVAGVQLGLTTVR